MRYIPYAAPQPLVKPFFVYPGGKTRSAALLDEILFNLCHLLTPDLEYREPFIGGGGGFLNLAHRLKEGQRVWLNDKDCSLACLWTACLNWPEELIKQAFPLWGATDALWRALVRQSKDRIDPADTKDKVLQSAVARLIVQNLGYNGGPNPGRKPPLSSVSYSTVFLKIRRVHRILNRLRVKITATDFEPVLTAKGKALYYLDPPYYRKGPKSYKHYFKPPDHQRLMEALTAMRRDWVLSYDDCPEVRQLYGVPNRIPGIPSPPRHAELLSLRCISSMIKRSYYELLLTTHKTAGKVQRAYEASEAALQAQ